MTSRRWFVLPALIGTAAILTLIGAPSATSPHAQAAPPAAAAATPGRYLLMGGSESSLYCIDSQTGQVWMKVTAIKTWQDDGNPVTGKPQP